MTVFVLSTATGGICYPFYEDSPSGGLPIIRKQIRIHGGAGLPTLTGGFGDMAKDEQGYPMWTPKGTVTPVPDAAFALLKDHPTFKKHLESGFLKIVNEDIVGNHSAVEKHVRTMEQRDGAAQLTPGTIKEKIAGTVPSVRTGESDDTWGDSKPVRIKG